MCDRYPSHGSPDDQEPDESNTQSIILLTLNPTSFADMNAVAQELKTKKGGVSTVWCQYYPSFTPVSGPSPDTSISFAFIYSTDEWTKSHINTKSATDHDKNHVVVLCFSSNGSRVEVVGMKI